MFFVIFIFILIHFDSACQRSKGAKYLAVSGKSINFAEIFVTSVGKIVWPLYVAKTIVYYKHLFYNGFN